MRLSFRKYLLAGLAGALTGIAWWFFVHHRDVEAPAAPLDLAPPSPQATGLIDGRPDRPVVVAQNEIESSLPRSPLGDKLNSPTQTAEDDVSQVGAIVQNYLTWMKEVPSGNNREITAKLTGRNARSLAPLAADVAAISPGGELLDRWGRPYAFHNLDRRTIEIRSRGPDGELYTPDDVYVQNGAGPEFLRDSPK